MLISSKDNEIVKEIKKLKDKKFRKEKYLVEGLKMLKEAINENQDIELIILKDGINLDFDVSNYKVITVTENIFNTLSDVVTPQGVLAVIKKKVCEKINDADFLVALDGLQDPGNLGTIIRTLDSANINQIIVSKNTVDCYSPKVIRSTMGAIYRVNVIETDNLKDNLINLNKNGYEVLITTLDGKKSIYDIDYNKKAIVIGNEANGVSDEIKNLDFTKIKIPMLGKTESLNASVATGIIIYEYVRQKIKSEIK